MVARTNALTPPKTNYDLARHRRLHVDPCIDVSRLVNAAPTTDSPIEDRPGLVGTVSSRRVTPPQGTTFDATPFQTLIEQCHERLDIAIDRGGISVAHEFYVCFRHSPLDSTSQPHLAPCRRKPGVVRRCAFDQSGVLSWGRDTSASRLSSNMTRASAITWRVSAGSMTPSM